MASSSESHGTHDLNFPVESSDYGEFTPITVGTGTLMTNDKALEAARADGVEVVGFTSEIQIACLEADGVGHMWPKYLDATYIPLVRQSDHLSAIAKVEAERDVWRDKWIVADEGEKLNAEFLAAADKRAETAGARVKELEAALAYAVKGLDMVHNGLMDPTRPRQSVGEVCAHFLSAARTGGSNG